MPDRILCVDDDQQVLDAIKRNLRAYDITTAHQCDEALDLIQEHGPFAVVVVDMRMPGMNGITFLTHVRTLAPATSRIMLTGSTDLDVAMEAINSGNIFRFLSKPCSVEKLTNAVAAGVQQYRTVLGDRDLLRDTLNGCVQTLMDLFELVNPVALSRAKRIQSCVQQLAELLRLPDSWQFELAAVFSQIGGVFLNAEIMEKHASGAELTPIEAEVITVYPEMASQLIAQLPHLDTVAAIVANQAQSPHPELMIVSREPQHAAVIGGDLLKVAISFERLLARGLTPQAAIWQLSQQPALVNHAIVGQLPRVNLASNERDRAVPIDKLQIGMILSENLVTRTGRLLLRSGHLITATSLSMIHNFATQSVLPTLVGVTVTPDMMQHLDHMYAAPAASDTTMPPIGSEIDEGFDEEANALDEQDTDMSATTITP